MKNLGVLLDVNMLIIFISYGINNNLATDISDYGKNETLSTQGVFNILSFLKTGDLGALVKDGPVPKITTTTQKPLPMCGRRMIKHNELIVGGVGTKPGDWPWHAAIYKTKRRQSNYICGGSLLSETRVLTAGHCVVELDSVVLPDRLSVTLGKYELIGGNTNTQEKRVFDIIIHPQFQSNPLTNDIAIMKLSSKVTYTSHVQPVCLWTSSEQSTKESLYGKFGYVVGWGFTEDDELGAELRLATLPVATDLDCLRSNPNFFGTYLTNKTFCVGQNDGVNACNGDSGGGYFFPRNITTNDNQGSIQVWYIRGIVSLSVSRQDLPLCDAKEYTLFTDVNQYLDFVNQNV